MRTRHTPEPRRAPVPGRNGRRTVSLLTGAAMALLAAQAADAQSAAASASSIVHGYGVGLAGLSAPVNVSVTGQNGDVAVSNGVGAVLSGALLAASNQGSTGLVGSGGSGGVGSSPSGAQTGGGGALNVQVSASFLSAGSSLGSTGGGSSSAALNGKVDLDGAH